MTPSADTWLLGPACMTWSVTTDDIMMRWTSSSIQTSNSTRDVDAGRGRDVSIVMRMSVCLCVCLFTSMSPKLHVQSSPTLLCMLPIGMSRSSSRGVAIRYVLPIIWMTSQSHIMATNSRRENVSTGAAGFNTATNTFTHQEAAPVRGRSLKKKDSHRQQGLL